MQNKLRKQVKKSIKFIIVSCITEMCFKWYKLQDLMALKLDYCKTKISS